MIERYSRPEMKAVWELNNKYKIWLEVEILAAEANNKLGVIDDKSLSIIKKRAKFSVDRILEIEREVKHDVIAFLTNVAENVGPSSKYIHYGLTSSDVVDTALAVQMKEASDIIIKAAEKLTGLLKKKAIKYQDTIMMGRSHGIHAEPTTLGLKLALWHFEMKRNLERLKQAKEIISVAKISGAVGTYANIDPRIEAYVSKKLKLKPVEVATQVIQRDRHAQYLSALAILAGSLEKFATEIRHLQRTEVREVEEPFRKGQKGSSAMPHKRNPILCERITGLARIVRSNSLASLENIALWHERDISHSSAERVILPDSTILIDYMLAKFTQIIEGLHVYPEKMKENLNASKGLIFSQRVLLTLVGKGMTREEAYLVVQRNAMKTWQGKKNFFENLTQDPQVIAKITEEELSGLFDYQYYLGNIKTIFKKLG
jgi:adenylosuccinate lyase